MDNFKQELTNKIKQYMTSEKEIRTQEEEISTLMQKNNLKDLDKTDLIEFIRHSLWDFVNDEVDLEVATDNFLKLYEKEIIKK